MVVLLLGTKKLDIMIITMMFKLRLILKSVTTVALADLLSTDNFFLGKMM